MATKQKLLRPKFFVPTLVILWLLVSIPLWLLIPQAEARDLATDDPNCPAKGNELQGVWGGEDHLQVIDNCYQVTGTLVYAEWWRGCVKWGWSTCSSKRDGDYNYYLKLDPGDAGLNNSQEIKNLQRYKQAQRTADFLTETIPDDQKSSTLGVGTPPCLDSDLGQSNYSPTDPCKGKGIKATFTGVLARDSNHAWKEIHPVKKQRCNPGETSCPSP